MQPRNELHRSLMVYVLGIMFQAEGEGEVFSDFGGASRHVQDLDDLLLLCER